LPLDLFLSRNPAPRYLIFLYAPENLALPFSWARYATFEAISFRVQQRLTLRSAFNLSLHPAELMGWVEGGLRLALTRVFAHPFPPEAAQARERDNGQLKVPNTHTLTRCDDRIHPVAPDSAWVRSLRSKYTANGTSVLVDAIPTAFCDPNNAFDEVHLHGIVDDDPLPHFPFYAYTDDGLLHTNAYGSSLLSNLIADQLRQRMEPHPLPLGAR